MLCYTFLNSFIDVGDIWRTLGFMLCTMFLFYSFIKAWKSDPGIIQSTPEQRYRVSNF